MDEDAQLEVGATAGEPTAWNVMSSSFVSLTRPFWLRENNTAPSILIVSSLPSPSSSVNSQSNAPTAPPGVVRERQSVGVDDVGVEREFDHPGRQSLLRRGIDHADVEGAAGGNGYTGRVDSDDVASAEATFALTAARSSAKDNGSGREPRPEPLLNSRHVRLCVPESLPVVIDAVDL